MEVLWVLGVWFLSSFKVWVFGWGGPGIGRNSLGFVSFIGD